MADNVTLNAGAGGDVIATEDIAGVEYQVVKLADGTATSTTPIPLSSTLANGLDVDVTRVGGTVTVDGSGVTQPVSGTITETNSTAILADTASMDTNLATVAGAVTGTEMQIDVVTSALPTGAATSAAQLADGHNVTVDNASGAAAVNIQDGGNVITVDGTVTANPASGTIDTVTTVGTVTTVTNDVNIADGGNSITTDIEGGAVLATSGSAGPANALSVGGTEAGGTFREFAVDASGNLQVDIVSGGTGSTQYAISDVAGATDTGTAFLGVRQDTQADFGADGDWVAASVDANGAIRVNAINADGTSNVDTAAGATDAGAVMLAVRDDSLTTLTPVDGDYVNMRVNSTGALHVTGGGGGTEYTEDVATANPIVGSAVMFERDDALSTLTPVEGDWASFRCSAEGALWVQDFNSDAILADTANMDTNIGTLAGAVTGTEMQVDVVTMPSTAVTNAGTFVVQEDGAALTALQVIDNTVLADDAAFTLTTSSVNMSGAIRDDTLSALAAVEGDAVPLRVGSTGALHVTGAGGGTQYNISDVLGATNTTTLAGVVRDDSLTTLTEADGDVSVLRVGSTGALHVTGGGGGTEYTEDVATANPQVGTATMIERDDALTTVTPVEGDWIGLRGSAEGALWVQDFNSDAILADTANIDTNMGTVAGAVSAGQMQVDIVADGAGLATAANQLADGHNVTVDNASLTVDLGANNDVTVTGGETPADADATPSDAVPVQAFNSVYNGTTWDLVREGGEAGSILVDLGANNDVTVSGVATAANQLADGHSVALSATDNAVLDQIEVNTSYGDSVGGGTEAAALRVTVANNSTGVLSVDDGGGSLTVDGTITEANSTAILADTASMDTNLGTLAGAVTGTEMQVDVITMPSTAVTNAGTFATQVDGSALTALQLIDNPVVAHDAAASGSTGVDMAGAIATNSVEGLTQVAAADASRVTSDLNGCLVVRNATTLEEIVSERVSNTNGTSTAFTGAFAAGGANIHAYITSVTIHNSHATTMGYVDLRDGSAGSVVWTFPAPATGGTTHNFDPPLKFAANTAVAYDVSAAITTVYISVNGFFAQG